MEWMIQHILLVVWLGLGVLSRLWGDTYLFMSVCLAIKNQETL